MSDGKQHSPIGASSAARFFACPGSVNYAKQFPNPTSRYSAEGTACHTVTELCLSNNRDADYYIDEAIEVGDFSIVITEPLAEAIQACVDFVRAEATEGSTVFLEKEFALLEIDPEAYGTGDAIILQPDRLVVIDYKFGQGVSVDGKDNLQLQYYALGGLLSLSLDQAAMIKTIDTVVLQPRARDGKTVQRAVYSKHDIAVVYRKRLEEAIAKTKQPNAPLVPGPHCAKSFCPARAVCPGQRELVENKALGLMELVRQEAKPLPPASMTVEEITMALDNAEKIESWISAVRSYALSEAERGREIPGYQLTAKRKNRRWIDPDLVIEKYAIELGDKLYNEPKLKSPAQVEKVIGKTRKDELYELTETPVGENTLVPVEHGRPEAISKLRTLMLISQL